ncbi:putative 2,3-bisphosphoglycerate-independent phosphoglycerate mutase [Salvia divinorum]|uniref:2,3-bisphosphoglycerate-independent phosphoglycerate mutase n=1 Tax=Salvia divinorum TaxID=28513 RepID=A0ABD1I3B9_SALDI
MVNSKEPKRRVTFILVDGVGDVSLPRFGYKTPLQVASVPNLDAIASAGINGLMDPVEVGLGLAMSPGDIAFKSNFATLDESTGVVTSRRADRHFEEEGPVLCAALDGLKLPSFPQYEVRVRHATEHRCGVVVKGPKLSGNISGTDPLKDNRPLLQAQPLDESDEAKNTAAVINELSKEISRILVGHPVNARRVAEGKNIANVVLLRGCGIRIEVPPFEKLHGLRPCMVAPTKIIADAIARALSAPSKSCPNVFVPGEDEHKHGRPDGYDFGFLHIKAIDDAGHDKASVFKAKGLEAVDKAIGQLAVLLWQAESTGSSNITFVSLGTILPQLKSHLSNIPLDPFPLPTVEPGEDLAHADKSREEKQSRTFKGDKVFEFNEIAAARGILGRFTGSEMMGIIKAYLKLS